MRQKLTSHQCREIESLCRGKRGLVRPKDVVSFARNPASALHNLFTWDDTKAAEKHRLWEARSVLQIYVRIGPAVRFAHRTIVVRRRLLVSLPEQRKKAGGGYNHWDCVRKDPSLLACYIREAVAELTHWAVKYRDILPKEFAGILRTIEGYEVRYTNRIASAAKRKKAV